MGTLRGDAGIVLLDELAARRVRTSALEDIAHVKVKESC